MKSRLWLALAAMLSLAACHKQESPRPTEKGPPLQEIFQSEQSNHAPKIKSSGIAYAHTENYDGFVFPKTVPVFWVIAADKGINTVISEVRFFRDGEQFSSYNLKGEYVVNVKQDIWYVPGVHSYHAEVVNNKGQVTKTKKHYMDSGGMLPNNTLYSPNCSIDYNVDKKSIEVNLKDDKGIDEIIFYENGKVISRSKIDGADKIECLPDNVGKEGKIIYHIGVLRGGRETISSPLCLEYR